MDFLTETRGQIIHRIMGIRWMIAQVPAQGTERPWNYIGGLWLSSKEELHCPAADPSKLELCLG